MTHTQFLLFVFVEGLIRGYFVVIAVQSPLPVRKEDWVCVHVCVSVYTYGVLLTKGKLNVKQGKFQ